MSEPTYNIIVTGELLPGASQEQATAAFAAAFKLDEEKAKVLLAKAPKTIKEGVSGDKAKTYLAAFKKMGLDARADKVGAEKVGTEKVGTEKVGTEKVDSSDSEPAQAAAPVPTQPESAAAAPAVAKSSEVTAQESSNSGGPHSYVPENPPGLTFRIDGKPDYSFLTVQIPADETIKVEASAMATMDTNIRMKTKMRGGLGRLLTGENLFINEFTAENIPGEIGIAPGTPGDLTHQYLKGNTIFLQNSAYVASTEGVNIETKWQGLVKGFFSGENLFLIRCSGEGDLWFNTYGAIIEIDVNGGYVVDTGNIVAFTEGLEYRISKVGGYKSLFFSGEGFVCRFSGSGKVWIQTRSAQAFTQWAHFYRPAKNG